MQCGLVLFALIWLFVTESIALAASTDAVNIGISLGRIKVGENGKLHRRTGDTFEIVQRLFKRVEDPWYKTLGIGRDSSEEEAKKAYRAMALKYHPDKATDETRVAHEEKMKTINEAFAKSKIDIAEMAKDKDGRAEPFRWTSPGGTRYTDAGIRRPSQGGGRSFHDVGTSQPGSSRNAPRPEPFRWQSPGGTIYREMSDSRSENNPGRTRWNKKPPTAQNMYNQWNEEGSDVYTDSSSAPSSRETTPQRERQGPSRGAGPSGSRGRSPGRPGASDGRDSRRNSNNPRQRPGASESAGPSGFAGTGSGSHREQIPAEARTQNTPTTGDSTRAPPGPSTRRNPPPSGWQNPFDAAPHRELTGAEARARFAARAAFMRAQSYHQTQHPNLSQNRGGNASSGPGSSARARPPPPHPFQQQGRDPAWNSPRSPSPSSSSSTEQAGSTEVNPSPRSEVSSPPPSPHPPPPASGNSGMYRGRHGRAPR